MSQNRMASFFESQQSLLGKLLVASPRVPFGFPFDRTVVLILQDSEEGIFGVVLNRPASADMLLDWQKVAGESAVAEKLVAGGPVQGPVLALHRQQELAEVELQGGLFVSVQQDAIQQLSKRNFYEDNSPFRIVLGAVNWPTEELMNEIDNGNWFVLDAAADLVFTDWTVLWEESVRAYGAESIRESTGIDNFPTDPLLN